MVIFVYRVTRNDTITVMMMMLQRRKKSSTYAGLYTTCFWSNAYASTCVCISSLDGGEHRTVWWSGVLSLDVSE